MAGKLHILPSHEIDPVKWDSCVTRSQHAMLYATCQYLNAMADNWSGIIQEDYEAVMPVCWRKKMGIRYAYTIPFIQQLGWYTNVNIDGSAFAGALSRFVSYGGYAFNYANIVKEANVATASNYILNLALTYNEITAGYSGDALNNIKKAGRAKCTYQQGDIDEAITYYQALYAGRLRGTTRHDYDNFTRLVSALANKGQAFARKVIHEANGETLSIALLLKDNSRLYNIMNSTTVAGRKTSANHLLFDRLFAEFAGSNLVFDFEGSDIPGIGLFYQKFGAVNQPYVQLHINRLPFPLNILKR